jgi:hypothetical protein
MAVAAAAAAAKTPTVTHARRLICTLRIPIARPYLPRRLDLKPSVSAPRAGPADDIAAGESLRASTGYN